MVLQLPPHLLTLTNKWIRKSLEFISTSVGLASHDRLFKDTHCIGLLELDDNDPLKFLLRKHLITQ